MNLIIYGLKEKFQDEIKYVGLTTGKLSYRLSKHLSDKKIDNKTNWIKKVGKDNVEIFVIEDNISNIDILHEKEIFYIDKYKKEGHKLTNITNGGEGWNNMNFTDVHKKNISLNHADVSGENNPMFGKTHTIESKDKIRNFRLNYKISDETKKKMSLSKSGENNNKAKLKIDDVLKIRQYYKSGEYSQNDLGKMFNVNQPAIYKIVNHITWKNI